MFWFRSSTTLPAGRRTICPPCDIETSLLRTYLATSSPYRIGDVGLDLDLPDLDGEDVPRPILALHVVDEAHAPIREPARRDRRDRDLRLPGGRDQQGERPARRHARGRGRDLRDRQRVGVGDGPLDRAP